MLLKWLTDSFKIWVRKMKIESSRQVWTERTDKRTLWLLGLLSEPKNLTSLLLAPTGAQGVTLSVCLSVRPSVCVGQFCLEQSIFIFLRESNQAVREHSESNQSMKIRVIQSEPLNTSFLAPTGPQGVTMCVRPSVRPFGSNLSRAVNLHHSGSNLQAIS